MVTDLLRYLLNVLRERGGALLGLARKGLGAIRSLLGSARGLLGPLLKRALSFVLGKVSPVVTRAREKVRDSLESLKRRAEAFIHGKAPEPEIDADEPASTPEPPPVARTEEAMAAQREQTTAAPPSSDSTAPSTTDSPEPTSQRVPRSPAPSTARTTGSSDAARAELALLAPALGRAFVRALNRSGAPRRDRPARIPAAS